MGQLQKIQHKGARGEDKEQEIANLFEKIMKENFPNLVKEIDIQVQEAQRIPSKMDPERITPRHIISKMPKVKGEENLKSSKRKAESYAYRGVPIDYQLISQK